VGGYDQGGALRCAGRVGSGFDDRTLARLHGRLQDLERGAPPFADPPRGAQARGVHGVEPRLVAEVRFSEGLEQTVDWYRDNGWWWEPIRSGDYRDYYERQYGQKLQS